MPVEELNFITSFDRQRFKQFNPADCANWYQVASEGGKRQRASYPVIGRRHVGVAGINRLLFEDEPRAIFKSIDFTYIIVGSVVHQIDRSFNDRIIPNTDFNRSSGEIYADFLVFADKVYVMLADAVAKKLFVINEQSGQMITITDPNAPSNPKFVKTFGNRFVVSNDDSSQWFLSRINLDGDLFDPTNAFSFGAPPPGAPLFNFASGKIRQTAVLHNQLYIFSDFTADIWNALSAGKRKPSIDADLP